MTTSDPAPGALSPTASSQGVPARHPLLASTAPLRYVAFGDSITVGAKATAPARRWVAVFARQIEDHLGRPVELVNRGVGDNTISPRTTNYPVASHPSARERVERDVVAHAPDLVTIAFGLNDLRFGTPVEVFAEELGALCDELRARLPEALLLCLNVFHMSKYDSFPPRDRGSRERARAYNAAIAQVAVARALPLADVAAAMAERDALIHEDGVHAGDLGHRLIGNRVFETLVATVLR